MDKIGIRTIIVNFDDEQLPYLSLVQGDAKTRGFDIVICDSDGKEIAPSDDYIVELVATGSNAPDTPYANRHTIKDGKYRVMIPTEALSESGFVFLQLVFYQKSTGAVIHTIEQKCPVYRSRGQEVVESNNLYVDITALRLGIERIDELDKRYTSMLSEEETRKSQETARESAEEKRKFNERKRVYSETIREQQEITRDREEVIRIDNEYNRVIAEKERKIKFDGWDKTIDKQMPISGGVLENYREKLVTVSEYGGSIDLSLGNVFQTTPTGSSYYSITNAVNGQAHSFTLIINMGSTVRALTFPASVKWQGGEIPDMSTANKTYVLTFMTVDGGTNWLGMFGGEF